MINPKKNFFTKLFKAITRFVVYNWFGILLVSAGLISISAFIRYLCLRPDPPCYEGVVNLHRQDSLVCHKAAILHTPMADGHALAACHCNEPAKPNSDCSDRTIDLHEHDHLVCDPGQLLSIRFVHNTVIGICSCIHPDEVSHSSK